MRAPMEELLAELAPPVAAWMGTAKAKERIVAVWEAAQPLNRWLDKHVGPSDLPAR